MFLFCWMKIKQRSYGTNLACKWRKNYTSIKTHWAKDYQLCEGVLISVGCVLNKIDLRIRWRMFWGIRSKFYDALHNAFNSCISKCFWFRYSYRILRKHFETQHSMNSEVATYKFYMVNIICNRKTISVNRIQNTYIWLNTNKKYRFELFFLLWNYIFNYSRNPIENFEWFTILRWTCVC